MTTAVNGSSQIVSPSSLEDDDVVDNEQPPVLKPDTFEVDDNDGADNAAFTCISLKIEAFRYTVGVSATKIFLGGFFWQAFAFIASHEKHLYLFSLAAGFGDGFGVVLGNVIRVYSESKAPKFAMLRCFFPPKEYPGNCELLRECFCLGFACFWSGFAWQPLVNFAIARFMFTTAAVFVGSICGTIFLCGMYVANALLIAGRKLSCRNTNSHHTVIPQQIDFIRDASCSMAVVGAAAFFVGTDVNWSYPENWLVNVVGVRSGENPVLDCLKAGFSTFLGFALVSFVQILILPHRFLWSST